MVSEIASLQGNTIEEVLLVACSGEMAAAFTLALKKLSSQNNKPAGP